MFDCCLCQCKFTQPVVQDQLLFQVFQIGVQVNTHGIRPGAFPLPVEPEHVRVVACHDLFQPPVSGMLWTGLLKDPFYKEKTLYHRR